MLNTAVKIQVAWNMFAVFCFHPFNPMKTCSTTVGASELESPPECFSHPSDTAAHNAKHSYIYLKGICKKNKKNKRIVSGLRLPLLDVNREWGMSFYSKHTEHDWLLCVS